MAIQKDHSYDAYYFMANNKVDSLRNEMAALKLWDSFLTKPICKWHAWSEKSSLETFISSQLDIYIYNKVRRVGSDNFCNPFIRKILQNQVSSTTIRYFAAKQPSQKLGIYQARQLRRPKIIIDFFIGIGVPRLGTKLVMNKNGLIFPMCSSMTLHKGLTIYNF